MRNLDLSGGAELITEADCWSLLATVDYGRLVVDGNGRPDVFPVNFELVGSAIVVQTNMGHKLLAALRGPVAFEADQVDQAARTGWSVVVHGHARDATDEPSRDAERTPWTGAKQFRIRIEPESITGRRIRLPADASGQGRTS
ncbi:MAG TPA: pyridoxamine 5'-phosphate oxidase family protein [Acidimicrobiales bacterium]|nr:pyridoxamine 5'-phosphate oxidase family protein [Acidimicrobiales bacterium]